MLFCYASGRLHQWYRTTADREMAFRDGYDTATQSLFSLATRASRNMVKPTVGAAASVRRLETNTDVDIKRKPQPRHRASKGRESLSETKVWQDRQAA